MNFKSVIGKEFELHDIAAPITAQTLRHTVADNVTFLLKRENLLPKGYFVIIPVGGDTWESVDDRLLYEGQFEIFAPDLDTIVAYGQVHGWGDLGGDLSEITVEITEVTGEAPRPRRPKKPKRKSKSRSRADGTSMRGMR